MILHAGDVCTATVLDELSGYAPVRAVRGNNDGADVAAWGAPDTLELEIAGLSVAMVHDGGRSAGRLQRLRDGIHSTHRRARPQGRTGPRHQPD